MKINLINISDTQSINMAAAMPQKARDSNAASTVDMDAVDEESGMLHRWHVECNLAFIEELKGMD